ncbi:MAG TPA: pseudouridylate synthase, partial [Sutterella sp.]|nr:pseudouridylate synthase [Sutterella sp.]
MMAGAIRKTYLAVVRGWMSEERLIDKPLGAVKDEALGRQGE